jgi:hypothetical protein
VPPSERLLTTSGSGAEPAPATPSPLPTVGRWNDNELILFFEQRRESWIVYPPRSAYGFVRRPSRDAAVVEFHPWAPLAEPDQHPVRPRDGCVLHGVDCAAGRAIQAAVDTGFDPFR